MKPLLVSLILALAASARAQDFDGRLKTPVIPSSDAKAPAAETSPSDGRVWAVIEAGDSAARTAAANAGVSIEEVLPGKIGGFAGPAALARVKAAGLKVVSTQLLAERFGPLDFPTKDAPYHNYSELVAEMKAIAGKAPGLVSMLSIGKSTQGRDLWALRFNSTAKGAAASAKPGIVFLGTHHAREHLSTEVPLLVAKHLAENRAQPELKTLLDSRDVYFIPMVNPDGVEHDISGDKYHMHRKNMRDNGDGSVGVDLNRNYAWGWGGQGASADPEDDTYRGPSAFSEPESKAVKAFVEARTNLKILLSYHTFSELILYPWGGSNDELADKPALKAFKAMAGEMAKMTGYTPQQSSDLYIATGDTCDWAWGARGIYAFTFELTPKSMWNGGFYPGAAAIASTFQSNLRPALYLIDLADDPRRAATGPTAFASGPSAGGPTR